MILNLIFFEVQRLQLLKFILGNLLLTLDHTLKISDFGVAEVGTLHAKIEICLN